MSSKFVGAKKLFFSGFSKVFKGPQNQGKVATIGGVRPAKNLAKKRKVQDDIIKTREKVMTDYGITKPEVRRDIRKTSNQSKINKKISNIVDKEKRVYSGKELEQQKYFKDMNKTKKADGGRIGRRFGGDTMKKKTNVEKIKETFSPKGKNLKPVDPKKQKGLAKLPRKVRNNMGYMKSGGRAGFKGGGADMTNVASDKTKKEAKKFEKRAKAASKDVKNIGRSFTSIMNEKYRP